MKLDTDSAGQGLQPLVTVAEMWQKWLAWVDERKLYQKHGEQTGSLWNYRSAMNYVVGLYGSMLLQDFGPYQLNVVRERMVDAGLARITINGYIARIKRIWRRAAAFGLIGKDDYIALEACEALHSNEGGRETERVLSVPEAHVKAVVHEVTEAIGAMIQVCCWSGCRTGEVRRMRTCDIHEDDPAIPPQLQGKCWVYRPHRHKSEHHHASRLILIGPQAQAIIEPWLRPSEPERYIFSPYETMVVRNRKYARKHGRQAGKFPPRPKKAVDRPYAASSMWVAIDAACEKLKLPHWHPHQLRHLAATRLAAKYGVEVTQILLGHADVKTTLKYVDPSVLTKDDRDRYAVAIRAIIEHG